MDANVIKAVEALKQGLPVVVFDSGSREGEADIMLHASFASPQGIRMLRSNAGGLVCLATDKLVAEKIGLPLLTDVYEGHESWAVKNIVYNLTKYGDKPAFSIGINHKDTFTGITDNDRSLTAREFAKVAGMANGGARAAFESGFKAPGHLQMLIGSGIGKRKGHTELGLELCRLAGLSPAILMCEMLGEGKALPKKEAMEYAKKNGIAFLEGKEICERA